MNKTDSTVLFSEIMNTNNLKNTKQHTELELATTKLVLSLLIIHHYQTPKLLFPFLQAL
jgi:hypothetical protein